MNLKNIPTFTTSKPGFMASTEGRNQAFIDRHTEDRKLNDKAKGISFYFDGELQDILGYDIPIWLSGEVTGDYQLAYVWNVEGTVMYVAEITYGHKDVTGSHAYIKLPEGVTHTNEL